MLHVTYYTQTCDVKCLCHITHYMYLVQVSGEVWVTWFSYSIWHRHFTSHITYSIQHRNFFITYSFAPCPSERSGVSTVIFIFHITWTFHITYYTIHITYTHFILHATFILCVSTHFILLYITYTYTFHITYTWSKWEEWRWPRDVARARMPLPLHVHWALHPPASAA